MYYRRKVLLALLEGFGSRLRKTDCEKLLFLFCQAAHRNYYDFFPYQYGGFSYVSYYDKNALALASLLKPGDDFALATQESFVDQLERLDREALLALAESIHVRGKSLVRKVYLEYPYFASRSRIARDVLAPHELSWASSFWNADDSPCLFTIGYEGLSIDAFLNKLIANNIQALVDVRNNPYSMKYGFSRPRFRSYVENAGMSYYHIPALGIPSQLRKGLGTKESYENLFAYYENTILPQNLAHIEQIKQLLCEHSRVALTCFEADPHSCHRHKITDCLNTEPGFTIRISHIV